MNSDRPAHGPGDAGANRAPPLRGLGLALALAWIALVSVGYLAALELGLALVP